MLRQRYLSHTALSRPSENQSKATPLIRTSNAYYTTMRPLALYLHRSRVLASKFHSLTVLPTLTACKKTTVPNPSQFYSVPAVFHKTAAKSTTKTLSCDATFIWTRPKKHDTLKYAPNQWQVATCTIFMLDFNLSPTTLPHTESSKATGFCDQL